MLKEERPPRTCVCVVCVECVYFHLECFYRKRVYRQVVLLFFDKTNIHTVFTAHLFNHQKFRFKYYCPPEYYVIEILSENKISLRSKNCTVHFIG
jgi:hypothetical protein